MTPEQCLKLAFGHAAQEAKKKPCDKCGRTTLRPAGLPEERRDPDRYSSKNFVLKIRIRFLCQACGHEEYYLQRSWHRRDTGEKVTPEYSLHPERN